MVLVKSLRITEHSWEESLTVGMAGWLNMSADANSVLCFNYRNARCISETQNAFPNKPCLLPWAFLLAQELLVGDIKKLDLCLPCILQAQFTGIRVVDLHLLAVRLAFFILFLYSNYENFWLWWLPSDFQMCFKNLWQNDTVRKNAIFHIFCWTGANTFELRLIC